MPTVQITPDAVDLLQNVADTLTKSRKIVIITGAGISTNSGIPDFRSENGLYSLIQEQFERAEANARKEPFGEANGTIGASTSTSFDASDRPTKRRRTSRSNKFASPPATDSVPTSSRGSPKSQSEANTEEQDAIARGPQKQEVAVVAVNYTRRITRSQVALRPAIPHHLTQSSVASSTSNGSAVFSDYPVSSESSQTDISTVVDTPEHTNPCTRHSTPTRPRGLITSSSPLSSPPPGLFDPYENAASFTEGSSHEDFGCSDVSDSEDTQQSQDFFSSQASNSNLRNMKGRDLFDSNIWSDPLKTSVFYRFATSLRQRVKEVEPTVTHRFIAQMRDVGKLARVYTQNIDEIEKKIGLSTDLKHGLGNKKRRSIKPQITTQPEAGDSREQGRPDTDGNLEATVTPRVEQKSDGKPGDTVVAPTPDRGVECVFLHGSLHALRCFVCGKLCDWDEGGRESRTLSGEQPECPHCAGATAARQERGKRALGVGKLRPDIVLYGEEHPQSDLISPIVQHDLAAGPDLLLVLGTSLRVHGLKIMVKEFAKAVHNKGGKVVFINFTKPSESAWGDVLDYWIEWDCDAWVEDLKTRKPSLWLSPVERLELERQRREGIAEKKREALKKRESTNKKKRASMNERKQESTNGNEPESMNKMNPESTNEENPESMTEVSPESPNDGKPESPNDGKPESTNDEKQVSTNEKRRERIKEKRRGGMRKTRWESIGGFVPKNPAAHRDDYKCGAHVVWNIFQTLAKIGGRPFDRLGYEPPSQAQEPPVIEPEVPSPYISQDVPPTPPVATKKGRRKRASVKPVPQDQIAPNGGGPIQHQQSPAVGPPESNDLSASGIQDMPLVDPEASGQATAALPDAAPTGIAPTDTAPTDTASIGTVPTDTAPTDTAPKPKTERKPRAKKPKQPVPTAPTADVVPAPKTKRAYQKKAGPAPSAPSTDVATAPKKKRASRNKAGPAATAPSTDVVVPPRKKRVYRRKTVEGQTAIDQSPKAGRALARSRKTRTSGLATGTPTDQIPEIPRQDPPTFDLQGPHIIPTAGGPSESQASAEQDVTSQAVPYPFQLRRLPPPLPLYQTRPTAARNGELSADMIPMIAPVKDWTPSSCRKIAPMEMDPSIGPTSPLTAQDTGYNRHYMYTAHHVTQPIYSDSLPGVSRQGVVLRAPQQQYVPAAQPNHNHDNLHAPHSPSDQLHKEEAANQLWQLRSGAVFGPGPGM
ncbi:hypothetical protein F5Y17DRAFT_429212 [Xylariaceae sp. FL0594]|nr:hypothetical protein F5Y17DRAFT_429212 [Xylariaceae sp. FL0594]